MADGTDRRLLAFLPMEKGGWKRNEAQRAEERRICYDLRLEGYSWERIGERASEALGWSISTSTARRRIEEEGLLRVQPAEDALRHLELDRLDRYLLECENIASTAEKPSERLAAMDRALKVGERRAKLLGLDAPERSEVTIHEVDPADAALAELIREERAKEHLR